MDVQDDAVRCRWDDPGAWQQFVLRLADGVKASSSDLSSEDDAPMPDASDGSSSASGGGGGGGGGGEAAEAAEAAEAGASASPVRPILYGSTVCLTAHNGRYVGSYGGAVEARRHRQGEFGARPPLPHETFVLESAAASAGVDSSVGQPLRWGQTVRFRAVATDVGGTSEGDDGSGVARSAVATAAAEAEALVVLSHAPYLGQSGLEGADYPTRVVDSEADPRVRLRGPRESMWTLHAGDEAPPVRIGLDVPLVRELATRVSWYGRGPHESYPDRYEGARLGVWEGSVAQQAHPYVRPQETGCKHESRWMALSDASGCSGLIVSAASDGPPLAMGCHHYDPDDLDARPESRVPKVRHAAELVERPITSLSVDGAHAGVGGIDSWGSLPMPHHRLSANEPCSWTFAMRPFRASEEGAPPNVAAMAAEVRAEVILPRRG